MHPVSVARVCTHALGLPDHQVCAGGGEGALEGAAVVGDQRPHQAHVVPLQPAAADAHTAKQLARRIVERLQTGRARRRSRKSTVPECVTTHKLVRL